MTTPVDPFAAALDDDVDGSVVTDGSGAIDVLRRGLAVSPELRDGIRFTVLMALCAAAGRIVVPVLIQQILDRGVTGEGGFQPAFVLGACAVATVVVGSADVASSALEPSPVPAVEPPVPAGGNSSSIVLFWQPRLDSSTHRPSPERHEGSGTRSLIRSPAAPRRPWA